MPGSWSGAAEQWGECHLSLLSWLVWQYKRCSPCTRTLHPETTSTGCFKAPFNLHVLCHSFACSFHKHVTAPDVLLECPLLCPRADGCLLPHVEPPPCPFWKAWAFFVVVIASSHGQMVPGVWAEAGEWSQPLHLPRCLEVGVLMLMGWEMCMVRLLHHLSTHTHARTCMRAHEHG